MFILSYLKIYAATTFIDKRILNNICFSFFWWRFLYKLITMPLWVIWYAHKYFHCVRMCVCHVKNFWKDREWSFHSVFNHRRTLTTLLCYFFHIFCASIAHQFSISSFRTFVCHVDFDGNFLWIFNCVELNENHKGTLRPHPWTNYWAIPPPQEQRYS